MVPMPVSQVDRCALEGSCMSAGVFRPSRNMRMDRSMDVFRSLMEWDRCLLLLSMTVLVKGRFCEYEQSAIQLRVGC